MSRRIGKQRGLLISQAVFVAGSLAPLLGYGTVPAVAVVVVLGIAFAGLQLSSEVENAMADRIRAAPELAHGKHRYDVADFGLTEDGIREQFGSYVDRFELR